MHTDQDIETISHKLNAVNTLTIYIEKYNDAGVYSIVAADEEGGTWIEIFAASREEARTAANQLLNKVKNQY